MGDRRSVALALQDLGFLAARERDDPRARRLLDEAIVLLRQIDDAGEVSDTLASRGWFAWGRADFPQARRDLEEALEIARHLGHRWGAGLALLALGCLAHGENGRNRASALLEESVRLLQETEDPRMIYVGLAYLGHRAIDQGRYALGLRLMAVVAAGFPDDSEFYTVFSFLQPSAHPTERAAAIAVARVALSEGDFAAARAEGQAMTLEQAVAHALDNDSG